MLYPYYRVTRYTYKQTREASWEIKSWFEHLRDTGCETALVETPGKGWAVWRMGTEHCASVEYQANAEYMGGGVKQVTPQFFRQLFDRVHGCTAPEMVALRGEIIG